MHYGKVKYNDIADGAGVRTSLFVSGCTHGCPGCFQPETWDFTYGQPFDEAVQKAVLDSLDSPFVDGLTLLGGEPMEPENQRALAPLVRAAKEAHPEKSIWLYTGDTLEDLLNPASTRHTEVTKELLDSLDVMVDGPFVEALRDITLRFRGSSNQRVIDMKKTRESDTVILWEDSDFGPRGVWEGGAQEDSNYVA